MELKLLTNELHYFILFWSMLVYSSQQSLDPSITN